MNCQEIETLKDAYADRELDLVRATEIERHLSDCPACSKAYENIRALSSTLKSADLYFNAPPQLKQSIRNLVAADARKRTGVEVRSENPPHDVGSYSFWSFVKNVLRFSLPIAGTAAVALLLTIMLIRPGADERLAQEVTASHLRSLMANHLTDVASSDQHTVKPWFAGKVDFAPPVKDLSAQGFPLLGGRLDYLADRTVVALVYQRNQHKINLFIWPATRDANTTEKLAVRRGCNLVHWNQSGMTFWAVSELNPGELRRFAELIK
jgi:anti-sigma factor RsiW